MIKKYIKIPIIEAVYYGGHNSQEIFDFIKTEKSFMEFHENDKWICIKNKFGEFVLSPGDYLVKEGDDFFPFPAEVFEQNHEALK